MQIFHRPEDELHEEIRRLVNKHYESNDEDAGNAALYLLTHWMFSLCDERSKIDGIDWGGEFLIACLQEYQKYEEES